VIHHSSLFLISTEELPGSDILAVWPLRIMSGSIATTPNPSKMPMAVSTDPSITPMGGTKKPAIVRTTEVIRQMRNSVLRTAGADFFFDLGFETEVFIGSKAKG